MEILSMGFLFLIGTIVASLIIIWGVAVRNFVGSAIIIVIYAILLAIFEDYNVFKLIYHNPLESVGIFCVYIAIGFIWSLFTLYFKVNKVKKKYLHDKEMFLRRLEEGSVDPDQSYGRPHIPVLWELLQNTPEWIILWPMSVLHDLFADFLTGLAKRITKIFHELYQSIYDKVLGDILKELDSGMALDTDKLKDKKDA